MPRPPTARRRPLSRRSRLDRMLAGNCSRLWRVDSPVLPGRRGGIAQSDQMTRFRRSANGSLERRAAPRSWHGATNPRAHGTAPCRRHARRAVRLEARNSMPSVCSRLLASPVRCNVLDLGPERQSIGSIRPPDRTPAIADRDAMALRVAAMAQFDGARLPWFKRGVDSATCGVGGPARASSVQSARFVVLAAAAQLAPPPRTRQRQSTPGTLEAFSTVRAPPHCLFLVRKRFLALLKRRRKPLYCSTLANPTDP